MRRNDLTNLIFLSADQSDKNRQENNLAHFKLRARVEKLFGQRNVFYCQGTYKGIQESTLGVIVEGEQDIEVLQVQANNFNQDSILFVDNQGQGKLIFNKQRVKLGAVTVSNEEPSVTKKDFTFIPMSNTYFWFNK